MGWGEGPRLPAGGRRWRSGQLVALESQEMPAGLRPGLGLASHTGNWQLERTGGRASRLRPPCPLKRSASDSDIPTRTQSTGMSTAQWHRDISVICEVHSLRVK